jgi:putative DNA primase/helicase
MGADEMFAPLGSDETPRSGTADAEEFRPLEAPAGHEIDEIHHPKLGKPSCVWSYYDAAGRLDGYVCRFERPCGGKEFRPYRYGQMARNGRAPPGWHWKGWGEGRPLYNLREVIECCAARVIVTEGEKKADAARRLFPDCVAVSPMNGAKSPRKTDWSAVAGRQVVIWPDNDKAGREFAAAATAQARSAGAAAVSTVAVPGSWPESWDLADALPEGVSGDGLRELLEAAARSAVVDRGSKEPTSEETTAAEAEVSRLAALPLIQYGFQRAPSAKALGVNLGVLDAAVRAARIAGSVKAGQGRPIEIPEVELWPDPVAGADLLEQIVRSARDYVVVSPRQADAIALWVAFTHAFHAFQFSPELVPNSAVMRSGKTRLVEVLGRMTRRPLSTSGISPAALLRVIDQHAPTMLIDEIDTLMNGDPEMAEALRGLMNSGFSRAGARLIKNVPSAEGGFEPREFSSWCPMVLAGIGNLPDTVADRSIIVTMMRKRPDEKVKRLRARDGGGVV